MPFFMRFLIFFITLILFGGMKTSFAQPAGQQKRGIKFDFPAVKKAKGPNSQFIFQPPKTYEVPEATDAVTSGRVDEDKWPDVVVAANREIGILYGGKNGVLEPWQKLASWQAGARNELIADLNGDGKPDILFTDGEGKIVILFNEGNRKFSDPTVQSFGKMRMLRAFDFNGDKKLDLIGVEEGVGVKFLLNDGRGTFKESQTVDYNGIWGFAIGDINGSRRLDLAITNLSYQSDHTGISIFSGQSDGSFTPGAFYPLGSQQLPPPLLEDFNGDGKPDLIVCNYWSHNVATALNKGDGTFGPFVTYPAAGFPGMAQSEDFNQDGNLDFVVAGAGSSQVAFYRNHGDGTFFEPLFVQTGGDDIRSCSVADFNQDGWPDIVTQNNASHTISILMNSGSPAMIAKAAADRKRFEQKIAPPPLNFTSGSPVVFEGDATPRLFLMNSDGSRLQQLTRTWGEQPVWSPDGTKIAYREIEKIRIIEANGNALGVIESARRDYKNMDPVWSADSKSVSCRCINVDRINLREFFQWEGSGKIRPIREEDYLRQLDRIALPEGKSLFLGASEYFLEKQGGSLASFSYPLPPEGMDQNLSQASQQVIFARKRKLQIAPFKFDNSGITIDFAKIREIATIQGIQPVWFPNGKELVFSSIATESIFDGTTGPLYRIRADGTGLTRLTEEHSEDSTPVISPDGKKIVFFRRPTSTHLYLVQQNGSGLKQLTFGHHKRYKNPKISPDGKQIVFQEVGQDASGTPSSFVMQLETLEMTKLPIPMEVEQCAWSPDSRAIAYTGRSHNKAKLYKIQSDGTMLTAITEQNDFIVAWVGKNLFVLRRGGNTRRMYSMDEDGGNLQALPEALNRIGPRFSPNGQKAVFERGVKNTGFQHLVVINIDGTGEMELTSGDVYDRNPEWSQDGTQVTFQRMESGVENRFLLNMNTLKVIKIIE